MARAPKLLAIQVKILPRPALHTVQVFNAWGKKKGVNAELYRFLSEGVRVQPEQTPEQVPAFDDLTVYLLEEIGDNPFEDHQEFTILIFLPARCKCIIAHSSL